MDDTWCGNIHLQTTGTFLLRVKSGSFALFDLTPDGLLRYGGIPDWVYPAVDKKYMVKFLRGDPPQSKAVWHPYKGIIFGGNIVQQVKLGDQTWLLLKPNDEASLALACQTKSYSDLVLKITADGVYRYRNQSWGSAFPTDGAGRLEILR